MKNLFTALTFLLGMCSTGYAQMVASAAATGSTNPTVSQTLFTDGECTATEVQGTGTGTSFGLEFNLLAAVDNFLMNGGPYGLITAITANACQAQHIAKVNGTIQAVAVNPQFNFVLTNIVTGSLDYQDQLEIYAPEAATIELPISATASLTVVQTFCNSPASFALSKAELIANLGGVTATAADSVKVSGAFLETKQVSQSAVASINLSPGVNYVPLSITGLLATESNARGLSAISPVTCGSNAIAVSPNSLTVDFFTGPNGSPLPEGISIYGLTTGINYVDPSEPLECTNISRPSILITDDICAGATGSASIQSPNPAHSYSWSNGAIGPNMTNLTAGDYTLSITDDQNCTRSFELRIRDNDMPNITLPASTLLEENETVEIFATDGATPNLSYQWSTSEISPSILVNSSGTYSVTITTADGCQYFAESQITEYPKPELLFPACLMADYPFNGNADDVSGNENHGTVNGPTLVPDRYGNAASAYSFDGIDDYIGLPKNNDTEPENLTITAWFKSATTKTGNENEAIIIRDRWYGYMIALNDDGLGNLTGNVYNTAGIHTSFTVEDVAYNDDAWHFVAISFDSTAGIFRFYIDGIMVAEIRNAISPIRYANGGIAIGRDGNHPSDYFEGIIDDVKIFGCALEPDAIDYLYTGEIALDCLTKIYEEDFNDLQAQDFSEDTITQIDGENVLGPFFQEDVNFSYSSLPVNQEIYLCIDLWMLDSYDGNSSEYGPDVFSMVINQDTVLHTTFANVGTQSYPFPAEAGYNLPSGTGSYKFSNFWTGLNFLDAKYETCHYFYNVDNTISIDFDQVSQGAFYLTGDENWAIAGLSIYETCDYCNDGIQNYGEEQIDCGGECKPCIVCEEPTITNISNTCLPDGSYTINFDFTGTGQGLNYQFYEAQNFFGELDTLYFWDDGSTKNITLGPSLLVAITKSSLKYKVQPIVRRCSLV